MKATLLYSNYKHIAYLRHACALASTPPPMLRRCVSKRCRGLLQPPRCPENGPEKPDALGPEIPHGALSRWS